MRVDGTHFVREKTVTNDQAMGALQRAKHSDYPEIIWWIKHELPWLDFRDWANRPKTKKGRKWRKAALTDLNASNWGEGVKAIQELIRIAISAIDGLHCEMEFMAPPGVVERTPAQLEAIRKARATRARKRADREAQLRDRLQKGGMDTPPPL